MLDFLSNRLKTEIFSSFATIYEVRIRADKPITVKGCDGIRVYSKQLNCKIDRRELDQIFMRLCNHSIFSVESSLKQGFITSKYGERVGVCGEVVISDRSVVSIKNFTSLCIRFPNCAYGCSDPLVKTLQNAVSCLVISPPFHGKTTFIRDLGRAYSDNFDLNVLFVDERDELGCNGSFNLGKNSDVIRFANKEFGFYNGIRAYNPDVIITDEIMSATDCKSIEFAKSSGVKVVASAHAENLENLLKKKDLSSIIKNNTFDIIVLLNKFKIEKIYKERDWLNLF